MSNPTLTAAQADLLAAIKAGNGHPRGARIATMQALVDAGLITVEGGVERVGANSIGPRGTNRTSGHCGYYFDWIATAV